MGDQDQPKPRSRKPSEWLVFAVTTDNDIVKIIGRYMGYGSGAARRQAVDENNALSGVELHAVKFADWQAGSGKLKAETITRFVEA